MSDWTSAALPAPAPPHHRLQEVAQGRVWSGRRAAQIGLVDALGGLNRALQLARQAAGLAADEAVRVLEVSRAKVRTGWGGARCRAVSAWYGLGSCCGAGWGLLWCKAPGSGQQAICSNSPALTPPYASQPLQTSPLALLSGGGASLPAAIGMLVLQSLAAGGSAAQGVAATQAGAGAPLLLQALAAAAMGGGGAAAGIPAGAAEAGLAPGQVMASMPDVAVEGVASQALLAASAGSGLQLPLGGGGGGGLFDEE